MTKPEPARSRTTNWSCGNAALRQRGSLLIWLDTTMTCRAASGTTGRPPFFLNAAIQFCRSSKLLFRLPLGQTAGLVASPLCLNRFNALGNT